MVLEERTVARRAGGASTSPPAPPASPPHRQRRRGGGRPRGCAPSVKGRCTTPASCPSLPQPCGSLPARLARPRLPCPRVRDAGPAGQPEWPSGPPGARGKGAETWVDRAGLQVREGLHWAGEGQLAPRSPASCLHCSVRPRVAGVGCSHLSTAPGCPDDPSATGAVTSRGLHMTPSLGQASTWVSSMQAG